MYAFAYCAGYFYVNLSQVGEKQASIEKMLPADWPLGICQTFFRVMNDKGGTSSL